MPFSAKTGGIKQMGTQARLNQSLLKLDQAILSLLKEFEQTKNSINELSDRISELLPRGSANET